MGSCTTVGSQCERHNNSHGLPSALRKRQAACHDGFCEEKERPSGACFLWGPSAVTFCLEHRTSIPLPLHLSPPLSPVIASSLSPLTLQTRPATRRTPRCGLASAHAHHGTPPPTELVLAIQGTQKEKPRLHGRWNRSPQCPVLLLNPSPTLPLLSSSNYFPHLERTYKCDSSSSGSILQS